MQTPGDEPPVQTAGVEVPRPGAEHGYIARFRAVINTRLFIWGLVLVSAAAFLAVAARTSDSVKSMVAVAVVFVVWFIGAAILATRHTAVELLREYARQRNLRFVGPIELPESTPLLAAGEARFTDQYMDGPLSTELPGVTFGLAHHTFETYEEAQSRRGNTVEVRTPHNLTVCLVAVPEASDRLRGLYVVRRRGVLKSISGATWLDYQNLHRTQVENDAFARRYDVYVRDAQDEEGLQALFKPSFQQWMAELPTELYIEYHHGTLVVYRLKHETDTVELDAHIHTTARIARELRDMSLPL
jgi:hypothetical protein